MFTDAFKKRWTKTEYRGASARVSRQGRPRERAARTLEASGLDHGPISVHETMHAMGLKRVPPTVSLAGIFGDVGVARLGPKKRLRSAWRRFVYPGPERVLATGRDRVRVERRT